MEHWQGIWNTGKGYETLARDRSEVERHSLIWDFFQLIISPLIFTSHMQGVCYDYSLNVLDTSQPNRTMVFTPFEVAHCTTLL